MYMSTEHAKQLLQDGPSLLETSSKTGLSSTGRLHDHFVHIEAMTPGEYKSGGKDLEISYNFYNSPYGELIIASTARGICYMVFCDDKGHAVKQLEKLFQNAQIKKRDAPSHLEAHAFFTKKNITSKTLKLHLRGTPFQIKVWQALLQIPSGDVATYGEIAQHIDHDKAHRAVGTAVGHNPISYIIPCHRVIQSSGIIGNYMWGPQRKKLILTQEFSHK